MGEEYVLNVVVPVYKEEAYLAKTLDNLSQQSMVKSGIANIIISEYNPDNNPAIKNLCDMYEHTLHTEVSAKGISFARRMGIKHGDAPFITNFDGDSTFETFDALDRLIAPMEPDGDLVYTFCDNIPTTDDVLSLQIYKQLNDLQRLSPLMSIFECGFTVRRTSYERLDGFDPENKRWECCDLSMRLCMAYGAWCKQWVEGTRVLTSDRRISQLRGKGLNILNYDTFQFR